MYMKTLSPVYMYMKTFSPVRIHVYEDPQPCIYVYEDPQPCIYVYEDPRPYIYVYAVPRPCIYEDAFCICVTKKERDAMHLLLCKYFVLDNLYLMNLFNIIYNVKPVVKCKTTM